VLLDGLPDGVGVDQENAALELVKRRDPAGAQSLKKREK
jgi:hypothetical protein